METINIVELIEKNPITKLSKDYNVKLLTKIKEQFTDFEQQLFLSSFYCYLNCDSKKDFVIDLDNVWKWIGFSYKHKAKILLEKNFIIDKDYKISLNHQVKQNIASDASEEKKDNRGGQNKEIIMLNIDTFKNIAEAAKDANVSAPALRRRILTDVHVNNYHWIFDKNASHYN